MEPIRIEVKINVAVMSELLSLLSSALNRAAVPEATPAAKTPELPAPPSADTPVAEEPKPTKAAPAEKEYTAVDVRAAMDRTRRRIEGEDYKVSTSSESYKKWHKALTAWFLETAKKYGGEKPSALPDSESRKKFIEICETVKVEGDELRDDLPF